MHNSQVKAPLTCSGNIEKARPDLNKQRKAVEQKGEGNGDQVR